jgi:uncharacterized protein YacL
MRTIKNLRIFLVSFILFYSIFLILNITNLSIENVLTGFGLGLFISAICYFSEKMLFKVKLLKLNSLILGLFVGYLFGKSLNLIIDSLAPKDRNLEFFYIFIKQSLLLIGVYLGTILTIKNSELIHLSIPFIRFNDQKNNQKKMVLSSSALADSRIIDLLSSGILDQVTIPKFIIDDAMSFSENEPEEQKKILNVYKSLQNVPNLKLEISDLNFHNLSEEEKILRIAKITNSNILTADLNNTKEKNNENIRIINLHMLSNSLKPIMNSGEHLEITVQRYGKEPRQGIGYLEDGAMVVVNGGGDFIGEKINVTVLSVKHTSTGRIIFCNVMEKNLTEQYST